MKVAVTARGPRPTSAVDPQFERARYLVVFDTESDAIATCDLGECCCPPFDALITGRIGRKALHTYRTADVVIYVGARGTVRDAIEAFRAGRLSCAVEAEALSSQI